jgi:hypothetical protein
MPKTAKNWSQKVIDMCIALSDTQIEALHQHLPAIPHKRVALALRIGAQRHRLIHGKAEIVVAKEPEIAPVLEEAAPVVVDIPEPPAPPAVTPRPKKKVSFSAVSLDDASSLLSAFGTPPAEVPDPKPEQA